MSTNKASGEGREIRLRAHCLCARDFKYSCDDYGNVVAAIQFYHKSEDSLWRKRNIRASAEDRVAYGGDFTSVFGVVCAFLHYVFMLLCTQNGSLIAGSVYYNYRIYPALRTEWPPNYSQKITLQYRKSLGELLQFWYF